ncbi:MAG: hypothetical protein HC811_10590 [Flammeovirgaceae bacterium]|nr:hypothetical protein [Flammeovirgaceae bacterium]
MEKHYQLSDSEFQNKFRECTLDPALFSHEAHLRLTWIHLRKYGLEKACKNLCDQIQQFDRVHGKGDKFNMTVTIAAVNAVNHFIQKSRSTNFSEFLIEFPRLKHSFKKLISYHYSIDIFNSEKARIKYIEPDLLAFN